MSRIVTAVLLAGVALVVGCSSGSTLRAETQSATLAATATPAPVSASVTATSDPVSTQAPVSSELGITPTPVALATATIAPTPTVTPAPTALPELRVGAKVLVDDGFAMLAGKRVGVIANQTSVVDGIHLVDLLAAAPDVTLVAAFAPEHGLRGDLGAGETVADEVIGNDGGVRIPVFSLYGETRAPTADSLAGIDVVVYDLQDVGSRFYTYISTMGLAMQAAAAAGVDFVVLDRPNPIGSTSAGFVLTPGFESFVGQYPIPATYGLTAGELARMIVGERWLPGLDELQLDIVEIDGWDRSNPLSGMRAGWVAPSPGLPTLDSALVYPGTVLFEATNLSVGRGTDDTFRLVGAPWVDAEALAATLNASGLAGVSFEPVSYVPVADARSSAPDYEGQQLQGVRVAVNDPIAFEPVAVGTHLLVAFREAGFAGQVGDIVTRPEWLDLLTGTNQYRTMLFAGSSASEISAAWAAESAAFDAETVAYRLYG